MGDTVLFQERLPKYVFMGSRLKRKSIQMAQWTDRLAAILILIGTAYLVTMPLSEHDFTPALAGLIIAWAACVTLIYSSELKRQPELDGSTPITIFEDRITIPPRLHRKLTGESNFVLKEEIDHIVVKMGEGSQYIANGDGIVWRNSPIGLCIVTKNGKRHRLGHKPPSTVIEMVAILAGRWNVSFPDYSIENSRGTRYRDGHILGDYSYDGVMQMNLFEWQP